MKVKGNPNPKAEAEKHKTEEARSELKSKKEYSSDIQVKQEVKSEAKGEPKSESKKTEPKSEQKSEPKPEPKSEPKANTKSEGFNHGLSDSDDDFKVQSAKDPVGKTKADTSTKDEVGGEDQESGASAKNASNDIDDREKEGQRVRPSIDVANDKVEEQKRDGVVVENKAASKGSSVRSEVTTNKDSAPRPEAPERASVQLTEKKEPCSASEKLKTTSKSERTNSSGSGSGRRDKAQNQAQENGQGGENPSIESKTEPATSSTEEKKAAPIAPLSLGKTVKITGTSHPVPMTARRALDTSRSMTSARPATSRTARSNRRGISDQVFHRLTKPRKRNQRLEKEMYKECRFSPRINPHSGELTAHRPKFQKRVKEVIDWKMNFKHRMETRRTQYSFAPKLNIGDHWSEKLSGRGSFLERMENDKKNKEKSLAKKVEQKMAQYTFKPRLHYQKFEKKTGKKVGEGDFFERLSKDLDNRKTSLKTALTDSKKAKERGLTFAPKITKNKKYLTKSGNFMSRMQDDLESRESRRKTLNKILKKPPKVRRSGKKSAKKHTVAMKQAIYSEARKIQEVLKPRES